MPGSKRSHFPDCRARPSLWRPIRPRLLAVTWRRLRLARAVANQEALRAAVALYFGSMDFGGLAYATRRDRRLILDRLRESYGDQSFAALERKHVEKMLAAKASTPHAARNFLKALRAVIAIALRAGLRDDDPTAGIRVKVRTSAQGFRTWTEDDIAQFEAAYPIGSRARLAFALLLYTGQRRGDVIRMGRQHVKGGRLTVRQAKTGAAVEIPLHPELQAILAASIAGHLTFLTTATGKPFSGGSFTNWFGGCAGMLACPLAYRRMACAKPCADGSLRLDAPPIGIAAISGHATLQEVSRYTKAADQRRMAIAAMETIRGPPVANLPERLAGLQRKLLKRKGNKMAMQTGLDSTSSTSPSASTARQR